MTLAEFRDDLMERNAAYVRFNRLDRVRQGGGRLNDDELREYDRFALALRRYGVTLEEAACDPTAA